MRVSRIKLESNRYLTADVPPVSGEDGTTAVLGFDRLQGEGKVESYFVPLVREAFAFPDQLALAAPGFNALAKPDGTPVYEMPEVVAQKDQLGVPVQTLDSSASGMRYSPPKPIPGRRVVGPWRPQFAAETKPAQQLYSQAQPGRSPYASASGSQGTVMYGGSSVHMNNPRVFQSSIGNVVDSSGGYKSLVGTYQNPTSVSLSQVGARQTTTFEHRVETRNSVVVSPPKEGLHQSIGPFGPAEYEQWKESHPTANAKHPEAQAGDFITTSEGRSRQII
mmetsp:Transcript_48994/g.76424  ORF Transcript_48994/g.76424 Transcript_48994/m.76424 type:complete len:278 (+) Transcript_48994:154-987(+)|eukprot:CAMPEP_0184327380 /NCGR_PEP_ID=MMETSP1049-20130417/143064_1 /TAXON_ID=77928 /ORGANISM="Proteomonas sulcata, Strain CCMP704" /LENGTH=277 /DNA_ID=CAMNT_0026649637 /DNA_START=557 /DNA_END=1390 /DNA_ORIENTATION=-